jgi:hypothetical protein
MNKVIGEAIRAPHPHSGWLVRVFRYGSGRKLPAPRLLLDTCAKGHVKPFPGLSAALDVLKAWERDPRSLRQLHPTDVLDVPHAPAKVSGNLTNSAYAPVPEVKRHKRRAKPERPAVVKMAEPTLRGVERSADQRYIDLCVANGLVTRCDEFVRPRLDPRRGGGMLPAHLDPRGL